MNFNSPHFTIQELAPGVYAATGTREGFGVSNAAIIDLGGETLMLDTMNSLAAGRDLRRAAEELFGRPVGRLVISHPHGDHWKGNGAFGPETRILSTAKTKADIEGQIDQIEAHKADPGAYTTALENYRKRLETEEDERWRAGLKWSITRVEHALAELPDFEARPPDETFEGNQVFEGNQRRVELVHVGNLHAADDCYLVLPEDGIIFLADLGFFGEIPVMVDCDVAAWVAHLDELLDGGYELLAPGHGPVGGKAELAALRDYLVNMEALVRAALEKGGEEAARQVEPGAPFDAWMMGGMARHEAAIGYLIKHIQCE